MNNYPKVKLHPEEKLVKLWKQEQEWLFVLSGDEDSDEWNEVATNANKKNLTK